MNDTTTAAGDPARGCRKAQAYALVDKLNADPSVSALCSVHWDDSDADDRRFWVHLKAREALSDPRSTRGSRIGNTLSSRMYHHIRAMNACQAVHRLSVALELSPRIRYRMVFGKPMFRCYEGQTWVYVLTVGGPGVPDPATATRPMTK